ncbi:PIR Superfamily Protein [Plasmodium ovale curtisi]|uniref:PIR Superfamily Protein n=1 Tax=Plasmodium ovale curtisi TaxID=864141 RepID=A0A1A8XAB6_PLAOA|nr:PIR Superfamily Protein [Plasmodium ovale curtisi]
MITEKEEYNIFTNLHEYKRLELQRTSGVISQTHNKFCEDILSKYNNYKNEIEKHCKNLLYLCDIYYPFNDKKITDKNKSCDVFNYWFNADLVNINKQNILDSEFYTSISNYINQHLKIHECDLNLHKIEDFEFHNLKILYDLYYNFYNKNISSNGVYESSKCTNGCSHKAICAELFNRNIDKCPMSKKSKFCNELEQFRNKYIADNICEPCPNVPSLKPRQNDLPTEAFVDAKEQGTRTDVDQYIQEPESVPSNENKHFTPLGNYLNSKIIKKKSEWNNFDKEENEMLLNNPENEEIYLENTPYHIAYHSV